MDILVTPTTGNLNINVETRRRGTVIPQYAVHDNYEIYIIYTGERCMYVGHSLYRVRPGDAVMISSNTPHRSFGSVGFTGICLEFSKESVYENFGAATYNRIMSCFEKKVITVHGKNDLDRIYDRADKARSKKLDSNICLDEITEVLSVYAPVSNPNAKLTFESDISSVGNFIQRHYTEIRSLDDICERLNISKSHLCRSFKQRAGITVSSYINALRVQYAGNLLATTSLPVSEIAELCGYNNTQYFNRIFKSLIQYTPLKFRQYAFETGKYCSDPWYELRGFDRKAVSQTP